MRMEEDVQACLSRSKDFVEKGVKQIVSGQVDEQHGVSASPGATALAILALLTLGPNFETVQRRGSQWLWRQRQPTGWSKVPGGQADGEITRLAQTAVQGSLGGFLGRMSILGQARNFSEMILTLGEHVVPGLEGPTPDEIHLPKILERKVLEKLPPYGRPVVVAAALLAAEDHQSGVEQAFKFLIHAQMADGSWSEDIVATSLGILACMRFRSHMNEARRAGFWLTKKQYASGAWPAFDQLHTWSVGWAVNIFESDVPGTVGWLSDALEWLRVGQNSDGSYGSTPPATHPDLDDTGVALMGLPPSLERRKSVELIKRLQNNDGGWGTFPDFNGAPPNITSKFPVYIASPDVTIHVLEGLWKHRQRADETAIRRGLFFLLREQKQDGTIRSNWFEGPFYGTAQWVELVNKWRFSWGYWKTAQTIYRAHKKAQDFLLSSQNEDGSWGSSTVETALALAALWYVKQDVPQAVMRKGVEKVLSWQMPDGSFQAAYGGIYANGWNYEEPLSTALTVIRALQRVILK